MKIMETSVNLHSFSLVWQRNILPSLEIKMCSEVSYRFNFTLPYSTLAERKY